jgi:hypothetical protein
VVNALEHAASWPGRLYTLDLRADCAHPELAGDQRIARDSLLRVAKPDISLATPPRFTQHQCTLLSTELAAARLRSRALIEVSVALRFASRLARDRSAALRQNLRGESESSPLLNNAAVR